MPPVHRLLITLDPWLKLLVVGGTLTYLVEVSTGSTQAATAHPPSGGFTDSSRSASRSSMSCAGSTMLKTATAGTIRTRRWGLSTCWQLPLLDWDRAAAPVAAHRQGAAGLPAVEVLSLLAITAAGRSGVLPGCPALRPLGFSMLVIGLFCSVAIFETEHPAQPDKFRNLLMRSTSRW